VFSLDAKAKNKKYKLRFTPPFRSTLRPPVRDLPLGSKELDGFRNRLSALFDAVEAGAAARKPGEILEQTRTFGSQLLDSVVPGDMQTELNISDLYLEIGVDEPLIEHGWELLHDGTEFLCLKHKVARFVNVMTHTVPRARPPERWGGEPLSVLLISVPSALQRKDKPQFPYLAAAARETLTITEIVTNLGDAARITSLIGEKATFDNVYNEVSKNRHHVVHFNGHAYFDVLRPMNSSLVLWDKDMSASQILSYFGKKPPLLSFMNGCETAAVPAANKQCKNRFDIFSLARAFLDTGSYLIGNRWKVGDEAAAAFAATFYTKLVAGEPLGQVIRDARVACRSTMLEDDFSWASYIFYGDPRLCFRRLA
jgi:CHAT domain-containing protein